MKSQMISPYGGIIIKSIHSTVPNTLSAQELSMIHMSSEATLQRKCIVAHLWQTLSSDVSSHVGSFLGSCMKGKHHMIFTNKIMNLKVRF